MYVDAGRPLFPVTPASRHERACRSSPHRRPSPSATLTKESPSPCRHVRQGSSLSDQIVINDGQKQLTSGPVLYPHKPVQIPHPVANPSSSSSSSASSSSHRNSPSSHRPSSSVYSYSSVTPHRPSFRIGCLVLLLLTGLLQPALAEFYSFGPDVGDNKTDDTDDGGSGNISLRQPFPFFGQRHDKLYVSIASLPTVLCT
jgi:hypothetical protein